MIEGGNTLSLCTKILGAGRLLLLSSTLGVCSSAVVGRTSGTSLIFIVTMI